MLIPYYSFAIIYLIVVLCSVTFVGLNVGHMRRFGLFDFVGKLNTILVLGIMIIIVLLSGLFLITTPWTSSFNLFGAILL